MTTTNKQQPLGPLQKEWITALRSGKYVQGQGALKFENRNTVKHCCLGVACEIWHEDTAETRGQCTKTQQYLFIYNTEDGSQYKAVTELPSTIRDKLAAHTSAGEFRIDGVLQKCIVKEGRTASTLVELNDNCNMSFDEIADFIEEHAQFIFSKPV